MKLRNDTTDNIAIPLKGGGWADLGPGEEKVIGNVNTDHQKFVGLMAASAIRDVDAKVTEAEKAAMPAPNALPASDKK